jgi:hypothetical protein
MIFNLFYIITILKIQRSELGFHPFLISENQCGGWGKEIRDSPIVKTGEEDASSRIVSTCLCRGAC